MNFNSPLPRARQPFFHEGSGLRSVRDSDATARLWTKNNIVKRAESDTQRVLANVQQQLAQLRRRQIGGFVQQPSLMHPFNIYKPSNVSKFTVGVTFLGNGGTPTLCNIDSTVATNFAANPPTVNPLTDAWRFWTVRCGQVGIRFNYTLMVGQNYTGASPFFDFLEVGGNWEAQYNVQVYTDGHAPCYDSVDFDNPTTQIRVGSPAAMPIIISQTPSGGNPVKFALWIKISPDTSSAALPTALVVGNGIVSTASNQNPFASFDPTAIPIGIITYYAPGNFGDGTSANQVDQMLFDHAVRRFPCGNGNYNFYMGSKTVSNIFNFRGAYNYTDPTTSSPSDLTSQIFYPGDVVSVFNSPSNDGIYQNGNSDPIVWPAAGVWTGNWNKLA